MPDLGLYTVPDGPVPNWAQLLPLGRIDEARAAQEEAVGARGRDIVYVAAGMAEAGADFIDLDTAGAAGDADFLAALTAIERIRAGYPDLGIQIGMASEFVLGMHGELEYQGVRLAGLWPADQTRLAAEGGRHHLRPGRQRQHRQVGRLERGPHPDPRQAVLRAADRSPCTSTAGMGVGGVPMHILPPVDAVSRASRAASTSCAWTACRSAPATSTGQAISHGVASGMGGIRTAGDLVARMQMTRGMRLTEAKEHVAGRLGVSPADLSDPVGDAGGAQGARSGRGPDEGGEIAGIGDAVGPGGQSPHRRAARHPGALGRALPRPSPLRAPPR